MYFWNVSIILKRGCDIDKKNQSNVARNIIVGDKHNYPMQRLEVKLTISLGPLA